jgi:hypothetical protein
MKPEELICEIETAFAGVRREDGITLHEARIIDACGSDRQQRKARAKDIDTRWQDVPDEEIENHGEALCYLDIKGFRYYLPAYMRWSIKHYRTSASLSKDAPIYALTPWAEGKVRAWQEERWSVFSLEQCRAILKYLRFMAEESEGYADADAAQQAINWYWNRYR